MWQGGVRIPRRVHLHEAQAPRGGRRRQAGHGKKGLTNGRPPPCGDGLRR
eukprot:CAMPEP_0176123590 /NCGR_PEP_ID=MMETSP0120_2-20121206/62284_1 /TAXON_ID=160619 /ORGANISM="Kryptoperidinium foliaceum, Strain CCMP 1326" /LENGTH=49 /DNA_ID= /DNA_START= /DNA_END= /DNA_ORIENTATION=